METYSILLYSILLLHRLDVFRHIFSIFSAYCFTICLPHLLLYQLQHLLSWKIIAIYKNSQKLDTIPRKPSSSYCTMALLLSKNGLRSSLRASNFFQKISWQGMPPTPLIFHSYACIHTIMQLTGSY